MLKLIAVFLAFFTTVAHKETLTAHCRRAILAKY